MSWADPQWQDFVFLLCLTAGAGLAYFMFGGQ